ncbi:MAG: type II secretion system protein [Minisyncoccota bacterium]
MKLKSGFTLIELLVVIAIIGILSSVVLASLNTARSKGADAATKSNLNNIRAQAELVYDNNSGSYNTVCNATQDANVAKGVAAAAVSSGNTTVDNAIGNVGATTKTSCHSSASGWAVEAPLKSQTGYWCVDSTGSSGVETAVLEANSVVCP